MMLAGNRGHTLSVVSVGDSFVSSSAHYNSVSTQAIGLPDLLLDLLGNLDILDLV